MNVSDYKRQLVVAIVVTLAIGFSASNAIADGGMAMLSDSVRPVAYDEASGPPPSPFADPTPDATPAEVVPVESGVANISSGGFVGEGPSDSFCDYDSCAESCTTESEFKKFLRCCPQPTGAWVRADYLLWWTKGGEVPPLITTSSDGSLGDGIIGSPYTSVLYGDKVINFANRSGIRASGGLLLGCGRAIEFDYMTLGRVNNGLDLSSNGSNAEGFYTVGNPFLARPIIDNATGLNGAEEIAGDELRGRIYANQSEYFQSYGILLRKPICCPRPTGCCDESCDEACDEACDQGFSSRYCALSNAMKPRAWRVDFLGGWRNYRLEEWTTISEQLVVKDRYPYIPGSTFDITDSFKTQNVFNGAELGLSAQRCYGRWSFDLLAKVGLGSQTQIAQINGQTILNDTIDPPETYEGGLLALDSNIGRHSRNKFVAIPQFGGEVSYQLTKYLRAHVGYNLIYWPNVVRSGALIDLNVDQGQIPPPIATGTRPEFTWNESDYWAQGLNFGLEARF